MVSDADWQKTTWAWCADFGEDPEETKRLGSEMMNAGMLRIAALEDALESAKGFVERYADTVDGDYGTTEPNHAARIVAWIDRVLA